MLFYWDGFAWSEIAPLTPPGASTVRWRELAKAGPCGLWTTGSYYIEPRNHTLVARRPSGIEADTDDDKDVDAYDLLRLISEFGGIGCDEKCECDFNKDGNVDQNDVSHFAQNYGRNN